MSQVLIITGMHRSATSLVASLFEKAGVALGERLLEPNAQNPRGFFEDVDFYEFHEELLHARGQTILVTRDFAFMPTESERARAAQLIAARAHHALWGWKDPRTALFLDFWLECLPEAQFLFVYRHPLDVLLSLMRRREVAVGGLVEGVEAWYAYNRAIMDFYERHRTRSLLCHCYAIVDGIERFQAQLRERFHLELNVEAALREGRYLPDELRRAAIGPAVDRALTRIHPDAAALYAHMNHSADLPFASSLEDDSQSARVLTELARWFDSLDDASSDARRGLLFVLVGLLDPPLLGSYVTDYVSATAALTRQRAAWQQTAEERAAVIREQQAWAEPRMAYLRALEANRIVRALVRFGILPRARM